MIDVDTERLLLHPIDRPEGERIAARRPGPGDRWADGFPFDGDLVAISAFLAATAEHGEQRPFGFYRITRRADGRAIGGVGFHGRPVGGRAEIGYGLAASARGHGYAREAVVALLGVATAHGVDVVVASTTPDNIASRRTLLGAGFRLTGADPEQEHYEIGYLPRPVSVET